MLISLLFAEAQEWSLDGLGSVQKKINKAKVNTADDKKLLT